MLVKTIAISMLCITIFHATAALRHRSDKAEKDNKLLIRDTDYSVVDLDSHVRVLIDRDIRKSEITSPKVNTIWHFGDDPHWAPLTKSVAVKFVNGTIHVNGKPLASKTLYLRSGTHPSDVIRFNERIYRGVLKFAVHNKKLMVINIATLDDYLLGLLGAEMSSSWPMEALKAQAIASRTYALYMVRRPKHPLFDLESTIHDQVYTGAFAESQRIYYAVGSTSGKFLAVDGRPIKAYFHSRCGGQTESATAVWKGKITTPRVRCLFCQKNRYTWKTSIEKTELAKVLNLATPSKELSQTQVIQIKPVSRSPSGRISDIEISTPGGKRLMSSDDLRSVIGYGRIKSSFFEWKISQEKIDFEGVGAGHGVGMCQWGARHLAEQKKTYREILAFYYPHTVIVNLKQPVLSKK